MQRLSCACTGAEQRIWAWLGNARNTMLGGGGGSHQTRWQRQQTHARRPVLGVLGCMAERLKGEHPHQRFLAVAGFCDANVVSIVAH